LFNRNPQLIKKILAELKKEGKIRLLGRRTGCTLGDYSIEGRARFVNGYRLK
jgi:hypothetical protein